MVRDLLQFLNHSCWVQVRVSPLTNDVDERGDYHLLASKESLPTPSSRNRNIAEPVIRPECQRSFGSVQQRGPASNFFNDAPSVIFVVSPNLLKACAGRYILERHARANGQPIWKHKRRALWLFSTPTGRWAIASSDVKDGGFVKCSGWIYQACCHNGLMPDQTNSRWLLFDTEERAFISDETFMVTAPIKNGNTDTVVICHSHSQNIVMN